MRSIRKPLLTALVGGFALVSAASGVSAQQARSDCQGPGPCEKPIGQKKKPAQQPEKSKKSPHRGAESSRSKQHDGPYVGESARRAPQLQQAKKSRLPAPPKNQHYRVMDDRVVRVDDKTLKVVAIVGLASALLNSN